MQQEILTRIHDLLQAPQGELEFLNKLSDEEGNILAQHLAQASLHCRPEIYTDRHWEDD